MAKRRRKKNPVSVSERMYNRIGRLIEQLDACKQEAWELSKEFENNRIGKHFKGLANSIGDYVDEIEDEI